MENVCCWRKQTTILNCDRLTQTDGWSDRQMDKQTVGWINKRAVSSCVTLVMEGEFMNQHFSYIMVESGPNLLVECHNSALNLLILTQWM